MAAAQGTATGLRLNVNWGMGVAVYVGFGQLRHRTPMHELLRFTA